jgi:hypothetical protein
VVIDAEFDKEEYGSILATAIGRGLEPLDVRSNFQIRLGGPVGLILAVKKKCI